ncbi:MAG: 16S rRNA (guanine(966)-N(2))-methyltransferase RsmD [Geobacter sp.]|nr:16S rRNA (guanine(966)-N(2))-methyltransferase RsmD [Geobacter sp.]
MRVISGTARGRRLLAPHDRRVRPTSDRIKEALFSIIVSLRGNLLGSRVLDLCSGTGNLGIEALSRGADEAVFVDNHRSSAELTKKNLLATGFSDRSEIIISDARIAVSRLSEQGRRFHLVLADPPYGQGIAAELLNQVSAHEILFEQALVVIETTAQELLPEYVGLLRQFDHRIYGDTALTFFTNSH